MVANGGVDRVFDAMGHRYRRRLLFALLDENPQDAADPQGAEAALLPGSGDADADRVRAMIVHSHLPKLDATGYVDWDRETGKIRKGPAWEEIAPLLALLEAHGDELPDDWL